jgi:hypothetical protein
LLYEVTDWSTLGVSKALTISTACGEGNQSYQENCGSTVHDSSVIQDARAGASSNGCNNCAGRSTPVMGYVDGTRIDSYRRTVQKTLHIVIEVML